MPLKVKGEGPKPAKIMIVGEAPGVSDEQKQRPFLGSAGEELDRMLHDAGILRTQCYVTNVCKYRPYNNDIRNFFHDGFTKAYATGKMKLPIDILKEGIAELEQEILEVKPNVIIAAGNLALWALEDTDTAAKGIGNWRGSELPIAPRLASRESAHGHAAIVIPIYAPSGVLKQWSWRAITVHDLKARVKKYIENPTLQVPAYEFLVRPSYSDAMDFMADILKRLDTEADVEHQRRLSIDIETRQRGIACIGLGDQPFRAACLPLMCVENQEGFWTADEETGIITQLNRVLTHQHAAVVGQNFLYDTQYFCKQYGIRPNVTDDTMFMQHVCYAGMSKGLDFLSSMYCDFHQYWKEEGKEWDPKMPEEQLWVYNCKDVVITYEVAEVLNVQLDKLKLRPQYNFQMEVFHHVLDMMLRGANIDKEAKLLLGIELFEAMEARKCTMFQMLGHPLNPRSPKQMKALFYDDLGVKKQFARKRKPDGSRSLTLDDEALRAVIKTEPLYTELVRTILEFRSLGVFFGTFVEARLGVDGRMRCYFNPAGTETYRFSSSEDAFGSGTNLQNIPKGLEDEIDPLELIQYNLPNIRKLFIPDEGYTIFEVDLAGADAQVVAWEAEDEILKQIFREKKKLHVENGKMMYGAAMMGADGKREPYYTRVKAGVHLTNYGGQAKTMAASLNISVHEAEKFQKRWFEIHPPILDWHKRIESQLMTTRSVQNKFGYRRYYFDRIEGLLPQALAWGPQSTVAIVANHGLINTRPLYTARFQKQQVIIPGTYKHDVAIVRAQMQTAGVQNLLQVHDSLVGQYPTKNEAIALPLLAQALHVTIPYNDPLVIPWGLKTSTKSWGDAKERPWPAALTPRV